MKSTHKQKETLTLLDLTLEQVVARTAEVDSHKSHYYKVKGVLIYCSLIKTFLYLIFV